MKTYKSKLGKEFRISDFPKPADKEIIYLTPREFEWIKSSGVTAAEFDYIHGAKLEDHNAQIIPETQKSKPKELADLYCSTIIKKLKGGINDSEKPSSS